MDLKRARERLLDIYYRYHPPLRTSFLDDLEWIWGSRWGVNTEVGRLRKVLLHRPGREILAIKEPYEEWRYTYKPKLEEMVRDYERRPPSRRRALRLWRGFQRRGLIQGL
ncbi:hypothetical protein CW701_01950 [Candidatus Bathyarchaeota archaeon]|nr:MAG: hypothetical protein CW701_01950 [Candidatus Bathyarchaeota archaeon]